MQERAALVLSGGGALGAAHLGVLKVLERRGVEFDFVCGVSAGAIIGALTAMGMPSPEMRSILQRIRFFPLAFDLTRSRWKRRSTGKLHELIDGLFGARRFEDLPMPLHIGATDFTTGERVQICSGSIRDAVLASIAVPVFFPPVWDAGQSRWLVDGGLTQNLPLDWAISSYQGTRIYAVDVGTSLVGEGTPADMGTLGMRGTMQRFFRIMLLSQQKAIPADPRVRLLVPDLTAYSALSVRSLEQIIAVGEAAAEKTWGAGEG